MFQLALISLLSTTVLVIGFLELSKSSKVLQLLPHLLILTQLQLQLHQALHLLHLLLLALLQPKHLHLLHPVALKLHLVLLLPPNHNHLQIILEFILVLL
ncbi:hypothetical protein C2G38_2059742 [Gigaspora rosea]|uniref:Uncharacterized protein n=1 Tax=Gigaspora rosea TaxID=44941 RepID=A0A397W7L6_9GLOM|nr:hypothetical protein C2G38_2059742 [Gigaspora rosea]